jgi:hypothetical protein
MTTSETNPGSPPERAITSGDSWPKPLTSTCGPACIVSPLYVLLNLESRKPADALKGLPKLLGEHSGHTTVYLLLDAPSVIEGQLFLELHGLYRKGHLQSSFLGPVTPALYHPDWTKPNVGKKEHSVRLGKRKGTRAKKTDTPDTTSELPLESERGDVRRVGSGEVSLAIPDKEGQQTYERIHSALAALSPQSGDGPPQLHLPGVVQPEEGMALLPPEQGTSSISDSESS